MNIFITGWNGVLGRALLAALPPEEFSVTLASRHPPAERPHHANWVKFDLLDKDSENPDLRGIDIVYHLASSVPNFSYEADVHGTERLLKAAGRAGVKHFIYISIVGIDRVPLKYYRIKLATEAAVRNGAVPFTILRATQFHSFFTMQIANFHKKWLPIIPKDALFQPIDVSMVAKELLRMGGKAPQREVVEIGGPDVISLGEAMRIWMEFRNSKRFVLNLPSPLLGRLGRSLRQGALTTSNVDREGITWQQWLRLHHSQ